MKIAFISEAFEFTKEQLEDAYFNARGIGIKFDIQSKYVHHLLKKDLENKNFTVDAGMNLECFYLKFGRLDSYAGIIFHAGIENQHRVKKLDEDYKNLRKIFLFGGER